MLSAQWPEAVCPTSTLGTTSGSGFRFYWFRVYGLEFGELGVEGSAFRLLGIWVLSLGFRIQGLGYRV